MFTGMSVYSFGIHECTSNFVTIIQLTLCSRNMNENALPANLPIYIIRYIKTVQYMVGTAIKNLQK